MGATFITKHRQFFKWGQEVMIPTPWKFLAACIAVTGVLVVACDKSTGPGTQGMLRMYITDSPASYHSVVIIVSAVQVHKAGSDESSGWVDLESQTKSYDLLTLRNGASAILGENKLEAGHYTQIRLMLGDGCYAAIAGLHIPLEVASGMQTGIKLNHEFDISSDAIYELTLDFDASRSIHATGSGMLLLSPVIRIQTNQTSGSISGTVLPTQAKASIITTIGADTVETFADTTTGFFKLTPLPGGSYSLGIASQSPAYDDTTLSGISVTAGQNTEVGTITLSPR
jgi:hypothetical protein